MAKIRVEGGHKLTGVINISGAKNSVVALIPAAILCDEETTITNVPNISDIDALDEILTYLGAKVERKEDIIKIDSTNIESKKIAILFYTIDTIAILTLGKKIHTGVL